MRTGPCVEMRPSPAFTLLAWALALLGARLVLGQSVDCSNLLRSSSALQLSQLQPCLSGASQPMVLDAPRRFAASGSGSRQVLDLAYQASTLLLLTPGRCGHSRNEGSVFVR